MSNILRSNPDVRRWFATPDKTRYQFDGGVVNASYKDKDAIPFIILDGKFYHGKPEQSHFDLYIDYDLSEYSDLIDVTGRIWTDRKIVVTWENFDSWEAKKVVDGFKSAGLDIGNYLYVCDVDFDGSGKGIVYAITMDDFVFKNMEAKDLPQMYERQERMTNDYEDDETAQFAYSGVSGRLGRYLTTTWGDSVERDDLRVIVSEAVNELFGDNYKKRTGKMGKDTKTVKLTESQLRSIVKECVKSMVNESEFEDLMNTIDNEIGNIGDAHVSRFYSDENYITVAVHQDCGYSARKEVTNIMRKHGYDCYDMGGNGNYVMMTFRKI